GRVDFLLTGLAFEKKVDVELLFRFGPFENAGCRRADVADMRAMGLDSVSFADFQKKYPGRFHYTEMFEIHHHHISTALPLRRDHKGIKNETDRPTKKSGCKLPVMLRLMRIRSHFRASRSGTSLIFVANFLAFLIASAGAFLPRNDMLLIG